MDDDFGIGTGAKFVPARGQFRHEFLKIVYLTVEHHNDTVIFVEQRLLPARKVNDGKAAMAQTHAWFRVQATFVGPTMELRLIHTLQQAARYFLRTI